ncbi:glycoside hydrolase family 10 protein [Ferruginibacter yonginensis]|uniref:Glycoside hydrolase family 10 protein n=1 Tax=Ferruginibacter yonginensis TaxID=1310416 RepID=A0ABV8QTX7_9BACT
MKYFWLSVVSTFLLLTALCQTTTPKEFRGVWIATVNNIDWPRPATTNADEQKASFIALLNMHQRNGINAVFVQIRPTADAFYPSSKEPWSQWLTGQQGVAPTPYYDPLSFMINETHKRGMQFHAWFNPYRATQSLNSSQLTATHIIRQHPEWFITYGDKKYFDPGNKQVQQYVAGIVKDVVTRYQIDGVHLDDYFYPYKIPGKTFADDVSFRQYGNGLGRDAWRRSNVDSLIALLYKTIKSVDKKCRFGVSPFGVWRHIAADPMGSETKRSQTNYDDLYADVLLWLRKGWVDYVIPQLYWEIEHKNLSFNTLVDWWATHTYGKDCYIGIGYYRAGETAGWRSPTQVPRQIQKIRSTPGIKGMSFYSSSIFEKNPYGWNDSLRLNYFKKP